MLSEDPESLDALYNQGNIYMDHGKYELAAEQFRRALDMSPGHHAAFYKLGYALEYLGRLDEAIDAYNKAVETSPDTELTRPYDMLNFEAEAKEGIDRLRKLKEYLAKTSFYDAKVNRAIWHVREVMRESTPPIVD